MDTAKKASIYASGDGECNSDRALDATTKGLPETGMEEECSPHSQPTFYKVRNALLRTVPTARCAHCSHMQSSVKPRGLASPEPVHALKPRRCGGTVLRLGNRQREQTATGYRGQVYTINMRDPPKAPPLESSMSEKEEVGPGRQPGGLAI